MRNQELGTIVDSACGQSDEGHLSIISHFLHLLRSLLLCFFIFDLRIRVFTSSWSSSSEPYLCHQDLHRLLKSIILSIVVDNRKRYMSHQCYDAFGTTSSYSDYKITRVRCSTSKITFNDDYNWNAQVKEQEWWMIINRTTTTSVATSISAKI